MAWQGTKVFTNNDNYNYSELNRENNNAQYLKDELTVAGFDITLPDPIKTDYTRTDFPTVSAINHVRANIKALVDGFYPNSAPIIVINTARKQKFDSVEANVIEANTQAIFDMIENLKKSYKYSGTFSAGQGVIL